MPLASCLSGCSRAPAFFLGGFFGLVWGGGAFGGLSCESVGADLCFQGPFTAVFGFFGFEVAKVHEILRIAVGTVLYDLITRDAEQLRGPFNVGVVYGGESFPVFKIFVVVGGIEGARALVDGGGVLLSVGFGVRVHRLVPFCSSIHS